MSTYRERRAARAERLRGWAEKRTARTAGLFDSARDAVAGIPFGQPILVGHHSERRHRRDLERHDQRMRAAVENAQTAARMSSRADEIERQADAAIYRDDPDAIARLIEKIAGMEAERAAMKARNAAFRKTHKTQLAAAASAYERGQMMPHQAYESANLSGNISRARARLAGLQRDATPPPAASRPRHAGETATARAGLTVAAGMTTPSRPGKRPRTVYNVTGETLSYWRPLLIKLGGKPWGGAISFWDDPTDEIEAAIAVDEPAAVEVAS